MPVNMSVSGKRRHFEWSEVPLVRLDEMSLIKVIRRKFLFVIL